MKYLILDVETAPHTAYVWDLWKQNIPLQRLLETGEVLCVAAKFLGKKKIYFSSVWKDGKEGMLEKVKNLLDESDAVITYNGDKFDVPTLNKELLLSGMGPSSPYKSIDLYKVVKRKFRFVSNKLDYVAKQLGVGSKVSHPGFQLWVDCMNGNRAAQKLMREYNIGDVTLLEKVYEKLYPWVKAPPVVFLDDRKHKILCPHCGSESVQKRGLTPPTNSGYVYQRYQCQEDGCMKWSRGRKSISRPELVGIN